jgi:hypothetical protein
MAIYSKRITHVNFVKKAKARGRKDLIWKRLQICDFKEALESPLRPP